MAAFIKSCVTSRLALSALFSMSAIPLAFSAELEEVTVVAQKRSENLQDVPLTIQYVSSETLENSGITSVADINMIAPSVVFSNGSSNVQSFIRGIGSLVLGNGIYSSVSVYQDGVYIPRTASALFELDNVQSMQILKGPQGALYGRNATGGAIIVETVTPSPGDELGGGLKATVGSKDLRTFSGSVHGGLNDQFAGSLSFIDKERDGYISSPGASDIGQEDFEAIQAKLVFEPNDTISMGLTLMASDQMSTNGHGWQSMDEAGSQAFLFGTLLQNSCAAFPSPVDCMTNPPAFLTGAFAGVVSLANFEFPVGTSPQAGYVNSYSARGILGPNFEGKLARNKEGSFYASDEESATFRLTAAFDHFDFVSISNYQSYFTNNTAGVMPMTWDDDGAALDALTGGTIDPNGQLGFSVIYDNETVQQELRLVSTDSPFDWIVGLNYFNEEGDTDLDFNAFGFNIQTAMNTFEQTAYEVYGQATYPFTDDLSLTAGARYTDEESELTDRRQGVGLPDEKKKLDFSQTTYDLTLEWVLGDVLTYASYRTGFKSGSLNVNNTSGDGVDPEELDSYETGFKADLSNGKLRLNGTAFYYDFGNVHIGSTDVETGTTTLIDGATSEVLGAELELNALITDNLMFTANVTALDGEYTSDAIGIGSLPVFIDGNKIAGAPEFSSSLSLSYTADMGAGELTLYGLGMYSSGYFYDALNLTGTGGGDDGSYTTLNLSATYRVNNWYARVFANNVTDEEYFINGLVLADVHRLAMAARGTEVGLTIGYDFD